MSDTHADIVASFERYILIITPPTRRPHHVVSKNCKKSLPLMQPSIVTTYWLSRTTNCTIEFYVKNGSRNCISGLLYAHSTILSWCLFGGRSDGFVFGRPQQKIFVAIFLLLRFSPLGSKTQKGEIIDRWTLSTISTVGTMARVLPAAQDLFHITMRGHYYRVVGNGQLRLSPWATYTKQPLRKTGMSTMTNRPQNRWFFVPIALLMA